MADFQLLFVLGTAVVAFVLFTYVRWLTGKRLRLPPGPRPWPIVGNLLQLTKQPHKGITALAEKYGSLMFMKIGASTVVVASSPEMAKACLQGDLFTGRRPTLNGEIVNYNSQSMGHVGPGPLLTLLKKICTVELFSSKRIHQFKDVRKEEVMAQVLQILEDSKDGKSINLEEKMMMMSYNNISRMLFNKTCCGKKTGDGNAHVEVNEMQDLIRDSTAVILEPFLGDLIPLLKGLDPQGLKPRMWSVRRRWDNFLGSIIEEHRLKRKESSGNRSAGRQDFVDILLSLQEKEMLSDDLIKAQLKELVMAGSDTSANQATWTIAELVHHPDIQTKLQWELESVVGRDRLVDESDVPQLPYLQAVVKESFRRRPMFPFLIPHMSVNLKPAQLAGYEIPARTGLLVNMWAILRDPAIWKDPLRFDPDRFMDSPVDLRGLNFELIPFGSGRRACPGLNVGLVLVQMFVAQLVHAFDWSLPDGTDPAVLEDMELFKGMMVVCKPIPFKALPRLPLHVYKQN